MSFLINSNTRTIKHSILFKAQDYWEFLIVEFNEGNATWTCVVYFWLKNISIYLIFC